MRISDVTLVDIPKPFLVPQSVQAKGEVADVEDNFPRILAELDEGRGLVLTAAEAPPPLDLALRKVELFG